MSRFDKDFQRRARRNRFKLRSCARGALRLSVFRSERNISVQLIDDLKNVTLCAVSSLSKDVKSKFAKGSNKEVAFFVGQTMAQKVKGLNLDFALYFDKGGFAYHGRVKSLADGLREGGLQF